MASLNDLILAPGYESLLRANGLDSLEALISCSKGERLSKPGLETWRQRWRLIRSWVFTPCAG